MDQENSPFFRKIQPVGETTITPQTKQIILNVFFQLSTLNPEKTFRDLADETGMLTGVSGRTVSRLKAEENALLAMTNRVREEESPANDNDDENRSQASSSQNFEPSGSRKAICSVPSDIKKKTLTKNRKFLRYEESVIASVRRKSREYADKKGTPSFTEFFRELNSVKNDLPKFSRSELFALMKRADIKWFNRRYVVPKNKRSPGLRAAQMALKKAMRRAVTIPNNPRLKSNFIH